MYLLKINPPQKLSFLHDVEIYWFLAYQVTSSGCVCFEK